MKNLGLVVAIISLGLLSACCSTKKDTSVNTGKSCVSCCAKKK